MSRRSLIAAGILTVWVAGLGVLGYRQMFPDEDKRRLDAGLLVEPASYYYLIEQDGKHVGYASSQVDTTLLGLRLRNNMITELLGESDSSRIVTQFTAQLTPRLRLSEFATVEGSGESRRDYSARALGDSALEIRTGRGARAAVRTAPFTRHAVTPETAPFLLALGRTLRPGETLELEIFDRGSDAVTRSLLRIDAESLFVIPDSAAMDSSGRYQPAREDTVRAWRADIPGEGGGVIWFDRGGRMVAMSLAGRLQMRRAAFELAFENWRMNRRGPLPPDTLVLPPGAASPRTTPANPTKRG